MTKSKVGAEPKKQRIRHSVTKSEGIHEGIHRDEYGYYDSSYHCITPERVIRTAFKWCLDKGLITNPIYIK